MQLAFDFIAPIPVPEPASNRPRPGATSAVAGNKARRGAVNHYAGIAAEACVARAYSRIGAVVEKQRFRSRSGEEDLILRHDGVLVFVEVKKARSHDAALHRIGRRQFDRIHMAAAEFVAADPRGQLTEMRFDVATVDATGDVRLHFGILAHF